MQVYPGAIDNWFQIFLVNKFQIPHPLPFQTLILIQNISSLGQSSQVKCRTYFCTPPVGARQPEVLNVEVDWKKAEQKLLAIFQLDHDQLTSVLLSHLFWIFQPTFKLQLMILAVITMLWAFLNCFLLFLVIFLIKKLNTFTSACVASLYFDVTKWV